ncbi:MAG: SH3 domain-containing protein [Chloroflexi bacterium]|nr:MAG: SH3 domain-containing protein [Chloroflexota bacterium]
MSSWEADSVSAILRSTDGGVTWNEIARGGPALFVVGLLESGEVLTMNYLQPLAGVEFRTYPGNIVVEQPSGASNYPPVLTASGQALWRTSAGGLLLSDGAVFIPDRSGIGVARRMLGDLTPDKGSFLLGVDLAEGGVSAYGLETYAMNGSVPSRQRLYKTSQFIVPGWWSPKDDRAVVTINVPPPPEYLGVPVPALLDLASGEYRLLRDTFVRDQRPYQPYGRSLVDAVQVGRFARVVNTGSCLQIRAEPSSSGEVLDCVADGVLLHDTGESRSGDSGTWIAVTTPSGNQGWASAAFLER